MTACRIDEKQAKRLLDMGDRTTHTLIMFLIGFPGIIFPGNFFVVLLTLIYKE